MCKSHICKEGSKDHLLAIKEQHVAYLEHGKGKLELFEDNLCLEVFLV